MLSELLYITSRARGGSTGLQVPRVRLPLASLASSLPKSSRPGLMESTRAQKAIHNSNKSRVNHGGRGKGERNEGDGGTETTSPKHCAASRRCQGTKAQYPRQHIHIHNRKQEHHKERRGTAERGEGGVGRKIGEIKPRRRRGVDLPKPFFQDMWKSFTSTPGYRPPLQWS